MYSLHAQYVDTGSGFHVIELRDAQGNQHLVQIVVGATSCPTCGTVYPKTNLGQLDPKKAVAEVNAALNTARKEMLAYAEKHGVQVR